MAETAMEAAFRQAGITLPEDRLREIALHAMVTHADDTEEAIQQIWRNVKLDRDLMAFLFQHDYRRPIQGLIYRTRSELSQSTAKRPIERRAFEIVNLQKELEAKADREARLKEIEEQKVRDREYAEYLQSWQKTPIGHITINGLPVWQATAGTIRTWLSIEQRRHKTIERLIQGIPDDGRPIEFYRTPKEVMDIWRQISEDT